MKLSKILMFLLDIAFGLLFDIFPVSNIYPIIKIAIVGIDRYEG
jgi:hypothetical protein